MITLPPDMDILSPVDDHIFKTLLTHPEAKPVLIDVLSSSMNRMEISQDEHQRAKYRSRRMFETDMTSNILTAEERGENRAKLEIAHKMKRANKSIAEIMEFTGFTIDKIEKL